jgi:citrate lyase subunit beta / citryl-CoA lyase
MPPRCADAEEAWMRLRSMRFIPGDSERKFVGAKTSGGDAAILDLEDSAPRLARREQYAAWPLKDRSVRGANVQSSP